MGKFCVSESKSGSSMVIDPIQILSAEESTGSAGAVLVCSVSLDISPFKCSDNISKTVCSSWL